MGTKASTPLIAGEGLAAAERARAVAVMPPGTAGVWAPVGTQPAGVGGRGRARGLEAWHSGKGQALPSGAQSAGADLFGGPCHSLSLFFPPRKGFLLRPCQLCQYRFTLSAPQCWTLGVQRGAGAGPALQGPRLGWGDGQVLCRWGTM